jgi:hypothetical protein
MDFQIGECNSEALYEIIKVRGWENNSTFSLNIAEGPILQYFCRFTSDPGYFHVGCSTDNRPPNFQFSYERELKVPNLYAVLALQYSRDLLEEVCWKNTWFHDRHHRRDIDKTAVAFDNPENHEETLSASLNISKPINEGSGLVLLQQYFMLQFFKGHFVSVDGWRHLKREKPTLHADSFSMPYQLSDFARRKGIFDSDYRSNLPESGVELAQLGISLSDIVGELFYLIIGQSSSMGYDYDKEKQIRDEILGQVPVADKKLLTKKRK